ncbi:MULTISPECIES: iron ABC transporter permease [unclassified Halomonas]|uniref:ABC transporter permease n=1 Tax=unclassified Halomonas TaxID=2609666 RepID=UPI0020A00118|nr:MULTISPECIES: iron ABC transporter permease [unclassified Halomonas]MCP1315499.1 iron ABC transporter permease [Halomonas sp. 707D7]MCP1326882.1 iron ABC transporter permease [Halomonas sp. 707D4]
MAQWSDATHLQRRGVPLGLKHSATILGISLLALFGYLILAPVISILLDAIQVNFGDATRIRAPQGSFTDHYLQRVFTSPVSHRLFWQPLLNTLMVAIASMSIAMVVGGVMAWLLSRTDLWGRGWFATALIVPFMLPTWTFALAWTTLFKNRSMGGQPGWLEAMGIDSPDWLAYGAVPMTLIMALHYIPLVILLFGNALRRFDTQLEDSARILGAGRRVVALRIVLPLMRPALMSAMVLILADALGEFAVPYILGLPVQFDTLSTSLFRAISSRQTGVASVLAGAIMVLGCITLTIDLYLMREARRFVTLGGKGAMQRRRPLGVWRLPATLAAAALFCVGVVLPLGTLFLSTIMHLPGRFEAANFTLDYWVGRDLSTVALSRGILLTPDFWSAAWNSLRIVGSASVCAGLLGLLVGYVVTRTPWHWLASTLRQLTFMPYLVPGIAFAAATLSLFAVQRGPVPALYGTSVILMLALIADQMPFASRAGISAMTQLGREPEEAAQIVGAGWWRRMASIIVPIQKGALVVGIVLPFISGIKGVSLFIILAVPATDVLTTYSLRLVDYNYTQAANAVVLMIALLAWGGTVLTQKLTKTGLAQGLES